MAFDLMINEKRKKKERLLWDFSAMRDVSLAFEGHLHWPQDAGHSSSQKEVNGEPH